MDHLQHRTQEITLLHLASFVQQKELTWRLCWHRQAHLQKGRLFSPLTSGFVPAHHTQFRWESHKGWENLAPSSIAKRYVETWSEVQENSLKTPSSMHRVYRSQMGSLENRLIYAFATLFCYWRVWLLVHKCDLQFNYTLTPVKLCSCSIWRHKSNKIMPL